MTDFETHPIGTAATLAELQAAQKYRYIGKDGKPVLARDLEDRIEQLEAALMDANAKIPRFPDHMARIAEAKTAGLPERISAIVAAIQSIPDDMRQYQWQADDNQSFGSKWVRAVVGDNGKGMGRQAIAEVVSHIGVADYIAAANPDSVSLLVAALTRANAATAAAYEVAARECDYYAKSWDDLKINGSSISVVATAIRALATPDQTAALDKLIAEAVMPYVAALDAVLAWHDKDKHTAGKMTFERSSVFAKARAASKKGGA